uniref:Uncharacterized protein n=1 Tax=Tanacetum cinerariifolium TaxID=118510 RepID=A0A699HC22_TANCI|nr:hypothetical protein [Tanacetum cinerariifolium]
MRHIFGGVTALVNKRRRKKGKDKVEANAPPKVLRKDHAAFRHAQSTLTGKSLSLMGLDTGSTIFTPAIQAPPSSRPAQSTLTGKSLPLSSRKTATEIPSGNVATREVQGLFSAKSLESGKSTSFSSGDGSPGGIYQSGVVEMEVHGLHNQTKNLETLLEAEVDMKNVAEAKIAKLTKELESLRVQFSDLQVSNIQLSQQVSDLQTQVTGKEKIKAPFEEFKRYEDDKVEQRCAEMDACLDKLSVDFDEELYLHMLTAIVGLVKCMSEGLKHDIEHVRVSRDLAGIEAYDPEVDNKEDAPQWIRDLSPSSSQLKILIYPKVCDPKDPWAFKEEVQGSLLHPWGWFHSSRQI